MLSGPRIRDVFYSSYLQTYIERDVRALARAGDEMAFHRLLRAAAARTGQLINFADLARDVGADQKTVKSWISILETSGVIYLLQPYHSNVTHRAIKTPKLYFLDTGLCAYLTQWTSPETLEAGAMSGAILETWVIAEILKGYTPCATGVLLFLQGQGRQGSGFAHRAGQHTTSGRDQENRFSQTFRKPRLPKSQAARSQYWAGGDCLPTGIVGGDWPQCHGDSRVLYLK